LMSFFCCICFAACTFLLQFLFLVFFHHCLPWWTPLLCLFDGTNVSGPCIEDDQPLPTPGTAFHYPSP
jgi:hypothetical protein